jgi:translocator protein
MRAVSVSDIELFFYSATLTWLACAVGELATSTQQTRRIYARLPRAPWAPPAWVFPVAWTTLYLTMTFAYWLMRRSSNHFDKLIGSTVSYYVLLVLLATWTWVYFRAGQYWLALLWIIGCFAAAVAATVFFWLEAWWLAGALLIPLDCWLAFASTLNAYTAYHAESEQEDM